MNKKYYISKFTDTDEQTDRPCEFADIGKKYHGSEFSFSDYRRHETETISVFLLLGKMKKIGGTLVVSDLQFSPSAGLYETSEYYTENQIKTAKTVCEGDEISLSNIADFLSLLIRRDAWCTLYCRRTYFTAVISGAFRFRILCEELSNAEIRAIEEKSFGVYEECEECKECK